jgi:hypothetical protein
LGVRLIFFSVVFLLLRSTRHAPPKRTPRRPPERRR